MKKATREQLRRTLLLLAYRECRQQHVQRGGRARGPFLVQHSPLYGEIVQALCADWPEEEVRQLLEESGLPGLRSGNAATAVRDRRG